ncbi:serine hydrolase, partial [bacterium]|nr:serine hydrolase [bacterium]
ESQGIDSKKLTEAMNSFGAEFGGAGVSEVVVIRNGYMIWKGSNIDAYHTINSCTKTFTSTVLGLLVEDGKLALDEPVIKYLPSLNDNYPVYSKITFRHLASFTSGYDGERGEKTKEMPWGDPSKYLTPTEPLFEPGESFKYHDASIHLLGYVLTKIAGEPLENIYRRRIADPVGMTKWEWKDFGVVDGILLNSPSGIYKGGIHITARELARHGLLYLNRGKWNGKQLLNADWVDIATTTQVPASVVTKHYDLTGRFGFMWWTNGVKSSGNRPWSSAPPKAYTAHGGGRNFCFVIPEWNMVIVRLGDAPDGRPSMDRMTLWNNVLKKVGDAIIEKRQKTAISGDLKKWHTAALSFTGPEASESDNSPNPFLDYRLNVTFTGPSGQAYVVPGFYDGDGNGNGSGNIWKARFTPDEAGIWKYKTSFRKGSKIAVSLDIDAGSSAGYFDGTNGALNIADKNPDAPGFLKWGRLEYVNDFYLKFRDGSYWIKGGTDSPENFLAYGGFDNTSPNPTYRSFSIVIAAM